MKILSKFPKDFKGAILNLNAPPPSTYRSPLGWGSVWLCALISSKVIKIPTRDAYPATEMTKRPFPFETDFCRQSKTHLNNYENDIIALRDVRERTLKKLLEGPRRLHSIVLNNGEHLRPVENETQSKGDFMQKLVTNYITVNGKKINDSGRILISPVDSPSSCFFCETRTNAMHQCIQCLEFYCSNCSFDNYETFEDGRICLSCS